MTLRVDQPKTARESNTGPSTHTRFIAGPSGVFTLTVQPAQPPTAQAMNSSRDTWQGTPCFAATLAMASSIGNILRLARAGIVLALPAMACSGAPTMAVVIGAAEASLDRGRNVADEGRLEARLGAD